MLISALNLGRSRYMEKGSRSRGTRGTRGTMLSSLDLAPSSMDLQQLLVVITAGKNLLAVDSVAAYATELKKTLPGLGVMAIGVGEQV